jgi:hypothetical protein
LLTLLFLFVAALIFYGIYVAIPLDHEFTALVLIGSISLIFALSCYILESASSDPAAQRSLAWAFLAMGFSTLFLAVGLGPYYQVESTGSEILGLIVLSILLGATIALISWRLREVDMTVHQEAARQAWRRESPPSAFGYATANAPSVPTSAPPPSSPGPTPPPGGP